MELLKEKKVQDIDKINIPEWLWKSKGFIKRIILGIIVYVLFWILLGLCIGYIGSGM